MKKTLKDIEEMGKDYILKSNVEVYEFIKLKKIKRSSVLRMLSNAIGEHSTEPIEIDSEIKRTSLAMFFVEILFDKGLIKEKEYDSRKGLYYCADSNLVKDREVFKKALDLLTEFLYDVERDIKLPDHEAKLEIDIKATKERLSKILRHKYE